VRTWEEKYGYADNIEVDNGIATAAEGGIGPEGKWLISMGSILISW
jgi:hypothetical protein